MRVLLWEQTRAPVLAQLLCLRMQNERVSWCALAGSCCSPLSSCFNTAVSFLYVFAGSGDKSAARARCVAFCLSWLWVARVCVRSEC